MRFEVLTSTKMKIAVFWIHGATSQQTAIFMTVSVSRLTVLHGVSVMKAEQKQTLGVTTTRCGLSDLPVRVVQSVLCFKGRQVARASFHKSRINSVDGLWISVGIPWNSWATTNFSRIWTMELFAGKRTRDLKRTVWWGTDPRRDCTGACEF